MVNFNELKITPDGKYLIIDVSVIDLPYYNNIYIDNIKIDTQNTYTEGQPSSQAINVYTASNNIKEARVEINSASFNPSLNDNLFFVYVKVKGTPASNTPCGMDNVYTIGVVYNKCLMYNNLIQPIKEVLDDCSIPKNFINNYLRYKALDISIATKHYIEAISYYNKFFKNITTYSTSTRSCNCHG